MELHVPPQIVIALTISSLLAAGCRTPPDPKPIPVTQASASPSSVPSPHVVEPASGDLVLPSKSGSGTFQGLEISVVEVVEKRKMDGSGMMRATLRLRAAGKEETIEITSDEPKRTWNGYVLEYRGGWRDEVQLTIRRVAP
jgi:hypothetical protein